MTSTKEKAILIDLGAVRIKEYDSLNVVVERFEEVYNSTTKQTTTKWKFKGYASSISTALKLIIHREYLVDERLVKGLKDYLEKVETANKKVLEVLNA